MSEESHKKKVSWRTVWRESKEIIWARRGRLGMGLVLLIASRLAGMVLPATTKVLIDDVIGQGRSELLLWIAVVAGAATLFQAVTSFALAVLLGVAGQRAITDLRLKVQQHIGHLPVSFFEDNKSGELISRIMYDAEGIRNLVGTGFVQLIGGIITSVVALGVLLWLNWKLTLLTLILLFVFGLVMIFGFSRLRPIFRERGKINAEVTGRLAETLNGSRVVKAFTAEKHEERVFAVGAHRLLRNIVKSMIGVSTISSLASLLFGMVGIVMAIAGARAVLADEMTMGEIFMFMVFTGLLVTPLIQMSNIGTQITEAFAGLDRIRDVLAQVREDSDQETKLPLQSIEGEIAFENVSFEYKAGVPVLHGVDFVSPAGSITALVGPSGSGKSTIIGLVMAFRRPQSGRVTVDGHDLQEIRLKDYRQHLAVVLQDEFLFDGTIADNIKYGRPDAEEAEIVEAGRLARCDEFIDGFEDGYETIIGERGVKLSGGQRQRVAIARAILADPRILILDEATSSLDSQNEALIQEGLATLKEGRTSFVIAHRLSTVRNADQILVMEQGRIVERGSHPELLAQPGAYRRLYEQQFHIEVDQFINPGEDFSPATESAQLELPQTATGSGLPRD